jgi:hypothetical protein
LFSGVCRIGAGSLFLQAFHLSLRIGIAPAAQTPVLEDPRYLPRLPRFASGCRESLIQVVRNLLERPSLRPQDEHLPGNIGLVSVN